jgi:hypothetical protein
MREHYGEATGQRVADTTWIVLTAERGWIGFHKDDRIRRNELERRVVMASGARMFCIPRANISAEHAAARYLDNLDAICAAALSDGPFIYSVHPRKIERLL